MRVDCHCDTALYLLKNDTLLELKEAQQDWRRMRRHLDLQFMAVYTNEAEHPHDAPAFFRSVADKLNGDIRRYPDMLAPLLWREQLDGRDEGKLLTMLTMEGAAPLGENCRYFNDYFAMGLRSIGLTWNAANRYGGGCFSEGELTAEGRELISRCESSGVLVDLAHSNERTFWQALEAADKPLMVTHTCCAAFGNEYHRNLTDEQLKAVGKNGGVAGICFVADFLGGAGDLCRFCEHIEYAVDLAGSEHIAIGGDLDGCTPCPELADVSCRERIYEELSRRGMSDRDIRAVAGESVAALLRRVLPSAAAV